MLGQSERSGVLVIRAWTEGDGSQLRVRITSGLIGGAVPDRMRVVSSAPSAAEIVRTWLLELVEPTGSPAAATGEDTTD